MDLTIVATVAGAAITAAHGGYLLLQSMARKVEAESNKPADQSAQPDNEAASPASSGRPSTGSQERGNIKTLAFGSPTSAVHLIGGAKVNVHVHKDTSRTKSDRPVVEESDITG